MADETKPNAPVSRTPRIGQLLIVPVIIALLIGIAVGWFAESAAQRGDASPAATIEDWQVLPPGDVAAGKAAFQELKCHTCHRVVGHPDLPAPTASPIVPVDLGAEKPQPTRRQLVDSILVPSHKIEPGYKESLIKSGELSRMGDYSHMLSVRQLCDLVAFLESALPANTTKKYE